MLLAGGTVDGVAYLSATALAAMTTPATPADMPCGFMPGYGLHYGCGPSESAAQFNTCVV